jgi:toxin ParE1/3/4
MKSYRLPYELSQEADKDLGDIYDYTSLEFGADQAIKYLTGIEDLFDKLGRNPELGRKRDEIRQELRSISFVSHTVFYRIMERHIRIVRILHSSRDIIKFF